MLNLSKFIPCKERASFLSQSNLNKTIEGLLELVPAFEELVEKSVIEFCLKKIKEMDGKVVSSIFYNTIKLSEAIEENKKEEAFNILINIITKPLTTKSEQILYNFPNNHENYKCYHYLKDDTFEFKLETPSTESFLLLINSINNALRIISENDFELYEEIKILVSEFLIFELKGTPISFSGSSFKALGCIYINIELVNDSINLIDKIIHESAHQVLLSLAIEDELILNSDEEKFSSPLRMEFRTLTGIFHASFVRARIAYFLNKLLHNTYKNNKTTNIPIYTIKEYLNKNILQFNDCFKVLIKNARMTKIASEILNESNFFVREIEYAIK